MPEIPPIPGNPPMPGNPVIAGRAPIEVEVVAGKSYWWCACGRSATRPLCDGSHKQA
jgi:CDGSH-type Zn-finger protein